MYIGGKSTHKSIAQVFQSFIIKRYQIKNIDDHA
jgi:hypothetical protein